MRKSGFFLLILLLVSFSISLAWMRHKQTGEPFLPKARQTVWQVEARIDFTGNGSPVQVDLALPSSGKNYKLYNQQAASPGYGFAIIEKNGQRRGEWTKRQAAGPQKLYYKAEFIERSADNSSPLTSVKAPTKVHPVVREEPAATAANQLLATAMERSSSPQSLVRELIKQLNQAETNQNAALLLKQSRNKARLLSSLLNQAGIPAHVLMGLKLENNRRQQPLVAMVQITTPNHTTVINPDDGKQNIPENLLLWHQDDQGILNLHGGHDSRVSFSMIKRSVPARQIAHSQTADSLFNLLGVHLLPIETQSMFRMLFLLPIGALVVVFMRLLVGIKTSGTFMPVLIALAFLQTNLIPGLISFFIIVSLGLLLRSYLSYLNLLLVARISTLIVLVISIIAMMSLVAYKLGLFTGTTITFFPMIILAWTIERMSVLWEEEGPHEVLIQGSGSLFVALTAFAAMRWSLIQHLTFNFPELNLIVIALMLLMGQYTGYRLSELRRFRDLVKD